MAGGTVKVEATVPEETLEQLRWLSSQRGLTMADVLARAVERETYFTQQTDGGSKVLVEKPGGTFRQVAIK